VGTLGAIILYFREELLSILKEKNIYAIICLIVGTIPVVIAATLFDGEIEKTFMRPVFVASALVVTGLMLFAGQYFLWRKSKKKGKVGIVDALFIGVAQIAALLPGISRSGTTISSGLVLGVNPDKVFKFSFLLAIPATIGAACYGFINLGAGDVKVVDLPQYAAGMFTSFIVGMFCLPYLWRIISSRKLYLFGIYCFLLGMLLIFV